MKIAIPGAFQDSIGNERHGLVCLVRLLRHGSGLGCEKGKIRSRTGDEKKKKVKKEIAGAGISPCRIITYRKTWAPAKRLEVADSGGFKHRPMKLRLTDPPT